MSYTGITINGTDTLAEWGLILLDDLKIDEAKLKAAFVDVPGADGVLNLSYGMTGGNPVYEQRTISFTLFASGMRRNGSALTHGAPPDETEVNIIRTQLQGRYHGREVNVFLPDDPTHYFRGVLAVGEKSKFNSGRIPITLTAFPYRLKAAETTVNVTIPTGGSTTVTLANEQRRVVPTITASAETTIRKGDAIWTIEAGTTQISGLYLDAGNTELTVSGTSNATVTFKYQEGRL